VIRLLFVLALLPLVLAVPASAQDEPARSPHGTLRRSIDCAACHSPAGWTPVRDPLDFSHLRDTGFPLDGRHAGIACDACHLGLRFAEPRAAAGDCAVCHADVHQGRLAGECSDCHDPDSWAGAASLRAHARTSFPLTGVHLRVACIACHRDDRTGAFTRLDPACESCHRADYDRVDFPDHQALAYPTECRACHGTSTWHGARFDHSATGFGLVGVHASMACANCHRAPGNDPIAIPTGPEDCIACHQADYDDAHAGTGYPSTCTMCHAPTSWGAAVFDHDGPFFPIYSGRHEGRWTTCLDCHPTPGSFALFTCTTCHVRSETDSNHGGVPDYVYGSTRCYACHPRGEAGEG
jgi:hypothetical protein